MKLLRTLAAALVAVGFIALSIAPAGARPGSTTRIARDDRYETAVAISRRQFAANAAKSVVLASGEHHADALAGVPLAASERWRGPLLLTPRSHLDSDTADEIQRVLRPNTSNRVFILGGTAAISTSVEEDVRELGYITTRLAGNDRYETALDVAIRGLDNPTTLVMADGVGFTDALVAGPLAVKLGGAVLLTQGNQMPDSVAAYIRAHNNALRYAVGGPASAADNSADPIRGGNEHDTARLVAQRFFQQAPVIGVASSQKYPDALAGGVHIALHGGPMLLVMRDDITSPTQQYCQGRIADAYLYGGTGTVTNDVKASIDNALA